MNPVPNCNTGSTITIFLQVSDFGFLSVFGLRISDFARA